MTTAKGCDLPDDLYYFVEKHIWLRPEGEEVVMGLTDVAQHLAGKVIAVTIKKVGRSLTKGQSAATVESSKWVGPVPTPVSGEPGCKTSFSRSTRWRLSRSGCRSPGRRW